MSAFKCKICMFGGFHFKMYFPLKEIDVWLSWLKMGRGRRRNKAQGKRQERIMG